MFAPPELAPWQVRVEFLVYVELKEYDDGSLKIRRFGEYDYDPVGSGISRPTSIEDAEAHGDAIRVEYARMRSKFQEKVVQYELQGELLLRRQREELEEVRHALLVGGKPYKHLPLLVADFRARKGSPRRITEMAKAFRVDRSTIWRGLQDALAEGLIAEDELERRGKRIAG